MILPIGHVKDNTFHLPLCQSHSYENLCVKQLPRHNAPRATCYTKPRFRLTNVISKDTPHKEAQLP